MLRILVVEVEALVRRLRTSFAKPKLIGYDKKQRMDERVNIVLKRYMSCKQLSVDVNLN